jgi:hypothetical protein
MQRISIDVDENSIDEIVVNELVRALKYNLNPGNDEGGEPLDVDQELVGALVEVLKYYTTNEQYLALAQQLRLS